MKSTGIVRRIDDLGRIVIPREIRKMFGIREGDPLEICVENGCITFVPYRYDEMASEDISRLIDKLEYLSNGDPAFVKEQKAVLEKCRQELKHIERRAENE